MYNEPPPNLLHGIQLVQSGHRAEALSVLRYAARQESFNAEGWLWLAAATDDCEEYRHCVLEALRLDPRHPIAQKMRDELERQDRQKTSAYAPPAAESASGYAAGYAAEYQEIPYQTMTRRPALKRRVLRVVVLLILAGGCLAGLIGLAASGVVQDQIRDWVSAKSTQTLDFTIGDLPGYRFQVEVPDSWMPANTDNPSWRSRRAQLAAAFPDVGERVWGQIEQSFSRVVRNPIYGTLLPNVSIVETDIDALKRDNVVTSLTIQEIVPLPVPAEGEPAGVCDRMRLLDQQFQSNGTLASTPNSEVIDSALVKRQADCALVITRRYTDSTAYALSAEPGASRAVFLVIPVGEDQYATWVLMLADSAAGSYQDTINQVIGTLEYLPPK